MLKKRTIICVAIEGTYKTESIPVPATDAILVANPSISIEGARTIERENTTPALNKSQGIYGGSLRKISLEVENKGSGVAGTPPEFGDLLKISGMLESIVASTSVTYTEADDAIPSATVYYYEDGVLHKLIGCRATVSGSCETGEKGMMSFEITGHLKETIDAAIPTAAYISTLPVPFINVSVAIGGYGPAISKIDFDLGNTVATPASASDAQGYGEIVITERDMSGAFDPEATLLATKDWASEWKNGTIQTLSTGAVGSAAGNKYQVDMDVYYREISGGDRDGILTNEISCGVQALTFTYT
jgi:hypothetical protein